MVGQVSHRLSTSEAASISCSEKKKNEKCNTSWKEDKISGFFVLDILTFDTYPLLIYKLSLLSFVSKLKFWISLSQKTSHLRTVVAILVK